MKNVLVILFTAFSSYLSAFQEVPCLQPEAPKLYIKPENVAVDATGLSVYFKGSILSVSAVYFDEKGVYILPTFEAWCEKGHSTVCFFCEGCSVWYCPHRCRCPD